MPTTVETSRAPSAPAQLIEHLFAVVLGAMVAGVLVAGVGGRVFMRVAAIIAPDHAAGRVTDAGFIVGEITIGSVFFVIFVGLAAALVGAVVFVVCEPWMAWAGRGRGLVFGLVLLAVATRPSDALGVENRDFVILGEPLPLVLMIVGLFVGYGIVLVAVVEATDRRLPGSVGRDALIPMSVIVALGAVVAVMAAASLFFNEDACGCDVPSAVSYLLVALGVLTMTWWAVRLGGGRGLFVGVVGHVVFAATVALGARQTVEDIGSIL